MSVPIFREAEMHAKGWGSETWIANHRRYCGKLLTFRAGHKFSAHFHDLKDETFYVLSGAFRLFWKNPETGKDCIRDLRPLDVVDIPRLCVHQVEAIEAGTILEISSHHEDSDSYRVAPGDSQITAG